MRKTSASLHAKKNRSSPQSHKLKKGALFIVLIGFLGWYIQYFFLSQKLRVQTVECTTSDKKPCHEAVSAEFMKLKGQSIFTVQFNPTVTKTLKAYPAYQSLEVKKHFPNHLTIIATTSQTLIQIECELGYKDINALRFVTPSETSLPDVPKIAATSAQCVRIPENGQLDQETFEQLRTLITLAQAQTQFPFTIFWNDPQTFQLSNQAGQLVFVSPSDLGVQFQKLDLILKNTQINQNWKELDLRFKKPVLRYSETQV